MQTEQPQKQLRQGIYLKKTSGNHEYNPAARLLSEIINTKEVRTIIANAVPEILNAWAGKNAVKKTASRVIGNNIQNAFLGSEDISGYPQLTDLFHKPDHIHTLAESFSTTITLFFDLADRMGEGLDNLPLEEKKDVLNTLLSSLLTGKSGKNITAWARIISAIQKDDPSFFTGIMDTWFTTWIETTDFGEVKDLLASLSDITADAVKTINDIIWKYPAKVVLLVSFLPSIANIVLHATNECIGRFNRLAPDIVTDVILSCFRDIDTKAIGRAINEIGELIRKLDTGSALIGDSGVTGFEKDASTFIETLTNSLDMNNLFRAREGVAAAKATISSALHNALKDHPDITLESIRRSSILFNPAIRSMNRTVQRILDLPEAESTDAFSKSVSQLEFSEIAEIVNLSSLLINRIQNSNPKLLSSALTQIVDSLDLHEIENSTAAVFRDMGESLKPAGRIIMPHMIKMVCQWFAPEEDQDNNAMEEVRKAIQTLLPQKEVSP